MNGSAHCVASRRPSAPTWIVLAFWIVVASTPAGSAAVTGGEPAAIAVIPATSTADFSTGTHDGTGVSELDNAADGGQLRLEPAFADLFLSFELDTLWTITSPSAGYNPVIEDGVLDLQERDDDLYERSAIESRDAFTAGVVCEVRAALYPGSAFVNLGFTSSTASPDQWLYFSTRGTGDGAVPTLFTSMRTATSSTINVPTIVSLGEYHVFRIVWTPGTAEFWVDGVLVDTRTDVDIDLPQRVGLYKSDDSDSPYLVDWVRVTPYVATSGAYSSNVQDGGEPGRLWTRLTWQGTTPAGTSAVMATRTGETAAPDTTWSNWSDVAADSVTSSPGRYLQWRATLATVDSLTSPVVDEVQLEFSYLDVTPPTILATIPGAGASGISCQTSVSATFDEPIATASVTVASFTLTPAGGDSVAAAVSLDATATVATLTPVAALDHATTYEARLTTAVTDLDGNALAADQVWSFTTVPPDLTAPAVLTTVPVDGDVAVLPGRSITVIFDEAIDPATVTAASFTVSPRDGAPVAAAVSYDPQTRQATLAPAGELALATTHEARLTTAITDVAGNALPADVVWNFTTRVDSLATFVATTAADFAAGLADGITVAELDSSDACGQLRLASLLADRFDAPDLDPQWHPTHPEGYVPVIENGLLDVQERDDEVYELSAIESYTDWGPGVVLEARAMFVPGSNFIDLGFDANTLTNPQYAWFSTAGTGGENGEQILYARVREYDHTTVAIETSAAFNQWHVFKIVWTHGRVDFYLDGELAATHTDVLMTYPMHAAFYKTSNSDTPFYIDWIRVTPYAVASGEYVSPVIDGGADGEAWLDLQWSGATPPGTSVAFATRTGESALPDSTWSDWSDVAGSDVTSPPGRHAQYRAILATSDPLASPVIDAVYLAHGLPGDRTPPQVIASEPAIGTVDVPIATAVSATFSEPIDLYTLGGESFTLAPSGGDPVSALVSYDPDTDTVTLVPDSLLAEDTLYEARLTTAIRDVAGNALDEDHVWSFTTEEINVDAPDLPTATALLPSYPNPFNPATTVRFDLARGQRVGARIYGIDGRLVRTLVAGELPAGRHERTWNGRDEAGHTVATGVYVLRLATEDGTHTHKLTMLK